MKRAIALHHQQRARNANSSTATSTSKIPVSGGLVAHWGGAPTPVPAADWVLWSVIYAFFKQCLSFQKKHSPATFCKITSREPWLLTCVIWVVWVCICFVHAALFGWAAINSRTLPPWASRSWRRSKKPSSRTDMYRCILLWVLRKKYVHCKLQTPPFPSQKKILSSSDPQKLTFYLTYITSDIRGLHFSPKRTSRMFSMITSWESLLACGRWSRTSSPFLTCLTPGLRPWKWFLETAQSGIVKINLKLWVKKEANGLALNIINFICQNLPTHQIWYYKQSWIVRDINS